MGDAVQALADATRRAILDELTERDGQSLFELCSRLTMRHGIASTRQAISQHLAVLEEAGLVTYAQGGPVQVPPPRHHAAATGIAERWPTEPAQEGADARSPPPASSSTTRPRPWRSTPTSSASAQDRRPARRVPLADRRLARRARRRRAAARARRAPGGQAVQGRARGGRHPVHLVRRRRRPRRARAASWQGRADSRSRRPTWARSPPPSSTTPAATSSRSRSTRRRKPVSPGSSGRSAGGSRGRRRCSSR